MWRRKTNLKIKMYWCKECHSRTRPLKMLRRENDSYIFFFAALIRCPVQTLWKLSFSTDSDMISTPLTFRHILSWSLSLRKAHFVEVTCVPQCKNKIIPSGMLRSTALHSGQYVSWLTELRATIGIRWHPRWTRPFLGPTLMSVVMPFVVDALTAVTGVSRQHREVLGAAPSELIFLVGRGKLRSYFVSAVSLYKRPTLFSHLHFFCFPSFSTFGVVYSEEHLTWAHESISC